jgi:hypothetical protein
MLVLLSCSSAAAPASRPVAASQATAPAPASQPASAPALPFAPASHPAVYPSLSGEQVRLLLAGVELEKGDLASDRDRWKERAKLAESYGAREAQELRTSRVVAWCVGGVLTAAAAIAGFFAGEAAAGKFAPVPR